MTVESKKLIKTMNDASAYMTHRLEMALSTKDVFRVVLTFVPAMQEWYAYLDGMPYIKYKIPDISESRGFEECERAVANLIEQLKGYFANV